MTDKELPFTYTVIRSPRRTLALEIRPELYVLVRAPLSCPDRHILRLLRDKEAWVLAHLERRRLLNAAHPEPGPEERAALLAQAREVLPQRAAYYSQLMGLHPTGIRVTSAAKRFGSCSSQGRLCFSWRLMQYPPAAIDYVVVHELAHLAYLDHSRDFWALVAAVLPDYQQRRALLKE